MRSKRLMGATLVFVAFGLMLSAPAWAASNNIIVTYAGTGVPGSSGDGGPATSARLNHPIGMALGTGGDVFVADTDNNKVRRISPAGVITTVAGTGAAGDTGDSGPATNAQLDHPTGLALDRSGNLFIADTGNNRVRRVSSQGTITTVAGRVHDGERPDSASGQTECKKGDQDDQRDSEAQDGSSASAEVAPAAGGDTSVGPGSDKSVSIGRSKPAPRATDVSLRLPTGLAVDSMGELFITETGANRVVEVRPDGRIVRIAGTGHGGFSGNTGPATKAALCHPTAVAVKGASLLISDTGNHQVRKVSGGTITAFAGTGRSGFSGDGGQAVNARLDSPVGIAINPLGDTYIVDAGNVRIREVTASGLILTFAGVGRAGFSGDGGPAELARIWPAGGITSSAKDVFFADTGNHRVRRVHSGGPPPALPEGSTALLAASAVAVLGGATVILKRKRRSPIDA